MKLCMQSWTCQVLRKKCVSNVPPNRFNLKYKFRSSWNSLFCCGNTDSWAIWVFLYTVYFILHLALVYTHTFTYSQTTVNWLLLLYQRNHIQELYIVFSHFQYFLLKFFVVKIFLDFPCEEIVFSCYFIELSERGVTQIWSEWMWIY